ncbi:MAG: cyclic nucleotide-binding domain-containing protein [Rhodospirillales bacterium]|nr:cyclic nucleotide-binding domain-containing protein [Rhodospirillales bacterium]MCB9995470.1 cyclic nucleotide-binding domain-containing protein [Rhodospirillales bacterium]
MADKKTSKDTTIHNRHFVPAGDLVIRQGDRGNDAYLIQSGKVRVYTEKDGREVELGKLGPGDICGEMALIVDEPRSATIQALENTNFIKITRPMMIERLAKTDPLIKAMMPMLIKRIINGNQKALRVGGELDDLTQTVQSIYKNMENALPAQKKRSLENAVKPKMQAFLDAVADFRKLYDD